MSGKRERLIDCIDERGSVITVIEATRDTGANDQAPSNVVYYTSDGYLVEPLTGERFRIALTREILTRL